MTLHRKFVFALLGVATFCVAIDTSALTLGRAKGAVFLGQALKLTVPAQVESGEGTSALCFEADVFYGDIRQEASRVGVASEYLPQAQAFNLTITAASIVNEPVVTVYLRAGCEHKISRRYVVLAELAPDTPQAPNLARAPLPSSAPPAVALSPPGASADSGVSKAAQTPRKPKPEHPVAVHAPPRVPKAASRRAHLKLEPWDLGTVREPVLKSSNELLPGEGEDLQKRALAAAVWRSLNATPQDIKDADSRAQSLEANLQGLRDTTAKNRQILEELTQKLNKAESERYSNGAVYALMLLLLLCGVGFAYARLRMRSAGAGTEPWYGDERQVAAAEPKAPSPQRSETVGDGDEVQKPLNVTVAQPVGHARAAPTAAAGAGVVDIDLHLEMPEDVQEKWNDAYKTHGGFHSSPGSAPGSRGVRQADFASSMSATLRAVNTKEMLDVRQQAEFFMTLGQHEEAIALLSENVAVASEADPLVYLDLLKILHTLGRKIEYDRYRSGFNAIFNGYVPVYADFNQTGSGLEAYPQVCKRIVALWPTEEVVDYIESCLVRTDHASSATGNQQLFDLGALHDLLMLHGVARRIASSSADSGFMPFSAAKGLHSDGPETRDTQPAPVSPIAPASGSVDFDPSEPPENLIDFDSSDLLPPSASGVPAKRRG